MWDIPFIVGFGVLFLVSAGLATAASYLNGRGGGAGGGF